MQKKLQLIENFMFIKNVVNLNENFKCLGL